jgi:hypothetical protein
VGLIGFAELSFDGRCGCGPGEFAQSAYPIREVPRRDFNVEALERQEEPFRLIGIHELNLSQA